MRALDHGSDIVGAHAELEGNHMTHNSEPHPQLLWSNREPEWDGAVQILVTHLDFEHNPFTQQEFFNEVTFVDSVSGTAFLTDAYWNYPDDVPSGTKLWKFGMDVVYKNFSNNFMIKSQGMLPPPSALHCGVRVPCRAV